MKRPDRFVVGRKDGNTVKGLTGTTDSSQIVSFDSFELAQKEAKESFVLGGEVIVFKIVPVKGKRGRE
jgi:hypothetical protein